jgi:hypothetical protein
MAKKRGGVAGFYDRNKKIIKPVAAGLAGMLGTPALGAAVGAAFGGLDREGKKGIGVDLGGAAKGGLSGYAAGQLGAMAGKAGGAGGLKGLLTGGKSAASGSEALQRGTASMNKGLSMLDGAGAASAAPASVGTGGGSSISNLLSGAGKAASKVGGYVERNKAISELGVKGLLSQLPSEESAIARQRLDLDERKFDMTEQQMEEERERRMFVNQYLRRQYPQYFQNG